MKKYLFLVLISLGFFCGTISLFTIKYECVGAETLPIYYASPFIYKSTSLATSLAYNYYLTGFIANWIIWFFALLLLQKVLNAAVLESNKKSVVLAYKLLIGMVITASMLNISIAILTFDDTGLEYYNDLEELARDYDAVCAGRWHFIGSL